MRGPSLNPRRLGGLVVMAAVLMLLAACTGDPQDTMAKDGDVSEHLTNLILPIFWIAVGIFVVVESVLVFAIFRFRRRPNQTGLPPQLHGNNRLEIAWTIAPALLLGVIAIPTVSGIRFMADTPENALQINVTAQQWWWGFEYVENGNVTLVTANDLVIPVGRPVEVTLYSKDIIHSFWVPKLVGKMDVVPNHFNKMWFNAKEPGVYSGQCTEFCQMSHAKMKFEVVALPQAEYDAWLANQKRDAVPPPSSGLVADGAKQFFGNACIGCHAIKGTTVDGKQAIGVTGPNLTHFATRERFAGAWLERNDANLARWLRNPDAIKPGAKMPNLNLTDEQIQQLVAYLQSLK